MNEAPLFLVGTGRCGSTIVYSCIAMHQDFAWTPSWLTKAPGVPVLAAANRFWDLPGTDRFRETRFFPKPVELHPVFRHWVPTYRREDAAIEVIEDSRANLVPLIAKLQRYQHKPRFLCKMAGRPVKIEVLTAAFPDARFVHITRDLKPTTSSLLLVAFYRGTGLDDWPWGAIPPRYLDFYESKGRAAEVAAAITLRLNLLELHRQLETIGSAKWIQLAYSDFVADPIASLCRLGDWAGFDVTPRFLDRIRARKLYGGADEKWRNHFTEAQRRNLDDFEAMVESEGESIAVPRPL